ncbi:MAG: fatty acyl-AMP ligase [Planctomycetaceae bacterium]
MTSIQSILADAAGELPDKPLFVFPETRWRPAAALTYAELARRAGGAARVIAGAARPGDRALLLFPTGPEFWEAFFGCLAAGVIAVPLKTPNVNRTSEQLERIVRDCGPALLLTDGPTGEILRKRAESHPYLNGITLLTPAEWAGEERDLVVRGTNIEPAYLQYTSGSTSHPKATQVSHASLLANAELIRQRMEVRRGDDSTVTWLPHYHDMGLVGSYLGTIYNRLIAHCLPPEEFVLHPARWLQLISEHSATICGGPTFGYRLCAEKVRDEELVGVDLSRWRVAYIGAERIEPATLRSFSGRFAPSGFRHAALFPCYGLGEATLLVTGGPAAGPPVCRDVSQSALLRGQIAAPANDSDRMSLAGSGGVAPGCDVVIADPATGRRLPDSNIGEVLVAGAGVTAGYYRRAELNRELFRDVERSGDVRPFLRTGDLGFLSDGELFITGRLKEMMIVRGRNLYPEDVEGPAGRAHEAVSPGRVVAFSVDHGGEEALVVAAELHRSAVKLESGRPVIDAVRAQIVAACGVSPTEIVLLRPAMIPMTSSGKLQRLAVRDSYMSGGLECLFREQLPPGT